MSEPVPTGVGPRVRAAHRALRSHVHVAVVDGPDTGWVVPVDARGPTVGRSPEADLYLDDDLLSRRHLRLRRRGTRVQAKDLGSVNGTRRRAVRDRPGLGSGTYHRRSRRIGRRWVPLRVGDLILAGASALQIRDHPGLAVPHVPQPEPGDPVLPRLIFPLLMSAGMIPLVVHSGGGPWRVLLVLLMPLGLAVAVAWPALTQRRRRMRAARATGAARADDPGGTPVSTAGDGNCGERPGAQDPAEVLVRALGRPATGAHRWWDLGASGTGSPPGRRWSSPIRRRRGRPGPVPIPEPGDGLALVGAGPDTAALARYLLCQTLVQAPPGEWRIEAELPWAGSLPEPGPDPHRLRVLDLGRAPAPPAAAVPGHPGTEPPGIEDPGTGQPGPAPGADTGAVHLVLVRHLGQVPPWCSRIIEVPPGHDRRVSACWARAVATLWAQTVSTAGTTAPIPERVGLHELLGAPTAADILRTWAGTDAGLNAPIGADARGPVVLDLVQQGPHAVVAGTTGSGKSELLLAWVLGLAARYPPGDLAFLLVDYKGGATFTPIADLPQVVGTLTDLDAATTARALASLRAELRRREGILARAGAANLTEYRRRAGRQELPRLMVIVDEFRVLADEHPEHLDALVRLAAQGRSLGIHLVLATQRPAGAISADMRANLTTRICLRVLEEADSTDTIGSAAAAHLPAVPGRAVLRTETTTTFQSAWGGPPQEVTALLQQITTAADRLLAAEPWRADLPAPWAPALPETVPVTALTGTDDDPTTPGRGTAGATGSSATGSSTAGSSTAGTGAASAVPWLCTDLPSRQRLGSATLVLPARLVASGPPGSGRTTAAATVARGAARAGVTVHVLADHPLLPDTAPAAGTWCPPTDPRRARRLLTLLCRHRGTDLVVIDDVDVWSDTFDDLTGPGSGADLLQMLLRQSRRTGLSVLLTTTTAAHRWAAQVDQHLVLTPRDPADAAMAGVPKDLIGTGWPPGRGVLLTARESVLAQVALDEAGDIEAWSSPARPPLLLAPLPEQVDGAARPGGDRIWLGIGGDGAQWVGAQLPPGATWLVVGGPGSGRSTTLRLIAEQLKAQGRTDVLVIDDADRIPATRLGQVESQIADPALAVVGAAGPDRLHSTYHAVAARLRDADVTVTLSPVDAHLAGADVRTELDPAGPVGRAVLVDGGQVVPLQIAQPKAGYSTASG